MNCRWLYLLMLLALVVAGSGCATTNDNEVSSIPWNRPQSWEGAGALGAIRPPGS